MTPTSTNLVDASSEGGSSGGGFNGGCGLKKGPWTAEEDAILVDYVKKHGEGNWNAVQRNSGLARCGKSCRLRWANHLRPNLKKGAFSPDEERLIVELHAKYGNKWARMASLLPGRTDNEIKNYWNTRVKRHQRQGLPLYPPDLQPQYQPPHHHHYHHHHQSSHSTPTTPTSSFSFQTHLSTPTTPTSHPYHPHHHQQLSPTPPPLSPLPSPHSIASNSFTFQTQMPSPSHHQYAHHLVASSAPISPISPLSSPSTNPNNGFSTLALFDFSAPRTPPVLQTPLRFKRFSSAPASIVNGGNSNVSMPSPTSFSLPLSPLTSPNGSHIGGGNNGGFTGLLSTSSSDFHKSLQEENEKMCSLFAAVTQPNQELPSSQMMQNSSPMHNMGIGIGSKLISRRLNKKKNGFISKDRQGNHGISMAKNGLLEDLLRDAKVFGVNSNGGQSSRDQNGLLLQDQNNNKVFDFDGFGSNWENTNSLSLSSGLEGKVETTGQTNTTTSDDYTKLLETIPSSLHVEFNDSGEISNGQSSVITDDNIGFDMQQIASLFPTTTTTTDHDRNLGNCSWDNLPRIC